MDKYLYYKTREFGIGGTEGIIWNSNIASMDIWATGILAIYHEVYNYSYGAFSSMIYLRVDWNKNKYFPRASVSGYSQLLKINDRLATPGSAST